MKKIVVPIDFSVYSDYALQTAAALAKKHNLAIELITMVSDPTSYSEQTANSGTQTFFSIKFAEKRMVSVIESDYLEGLSISYVIKHYKSFSELGTFAKDLDADLIIMGSPGTNSIKDYFAASDTEKTVRTSEIPILVVKEVFENLDQLNPVFISSFMPDEIKAYQKAMDIIKTLKMSPKLLLVNQHGENFLSRVDLKNRIETFLLRADGSFKNKDIFAFIESDTVLKGANLYAEQNNIGFIIMPTHGRATSIGKFFKKSTTLDLSGKSKYPILSIKI